MNIGALSHHIKRASHLLFKLHYEIEEMWRLGLFHSKSNRAQNGCDLLDGGRNLNNEGPNQCTLKIWFVSFHQHASMFFQDQRENHKRAITALSEQLKDTLKELREKTKEKKEAELGWKKENKERAFEEGKLRDNLQKRDQLIEVNHLPLLTVGVYIRPEHRLLMSYFLFAFHSKFFWS